MPSYPLARGIMYFSLDLPALRIYFAAQNIDLPSPFNQTWQYMVALLCHAAFGLFVLVVIELINYKRLSINISGIICKLRLVLVECLRIYSIIAETETESHSRFMIVVMIAMLLLRENEFKMESYLIHHFY